MKKILLAIMLTFGMASATEFIVPDLCNDLGIGCPGPVGPVGPEGPQGIQGVQGEQGPIGETGAAGATGATGADGETGAQGERGLQGASGEQGETGQAGATGVAGRDGSDGADGADGKVDYAEINRKIENDRKRIAETNAGAAAMAVIDFGNLAEGQTQGGFGFGAGDTGAEQKWAAAIGAKHGLSDDTAVVVKGYYGLGGNANGVGVGFVKTF